VRPGSPARFSRSRLKQLERLGVVESAPKAQGRGHRYQLTSSGHDLFKVCETLGEWGARWLEIAPENLDPFVALWSMCNAFRRDRLPDQRVVIRLDFTGFRPRKRYWCGNPIPGMLVAALTAGNGKTSSGCLTA
jgi:HxlR-like helix-turn-helix